jgi:multiple sugar transport system substrate-binding protein
MKHVLKVTLLALAVLLLGSGLTWSGGQQDLAAKEKVELEWWIIPWRIRVPGFPADQAPDGTEFIEWASKTFMEKHPYTTVKGVMVGNKELNQKMMAAVAAGTNPNVQWGLADPMQLAKAGLLVPVDEYLSREDKRDFVPKALEYFSYDGKVWAFPWAFGNNGMGITNLIYPPMFEEAGVDWQKIVEKGWTMDEFVEVGKKISRDTDGDGENDIFLTGFQGKTPTHLHTDWPWIHNFGGRLLNDTETKITLDSPETIAGLQFMVDAIYKHKIAPKGAEAADNYGVIKPFHAHNLAMGNGGPYEIGRIDRYVQRGDIEKFRPYVAPYPKAPGKKRGTYLVAQGMYVYKNQKNDATLEAAMEFAKHMTGKEVMPLIETVLYISARKSVNEMLYQTEEWLEFKPDIDRYVAELSKYGYLFHGSPLFEYPKIRPLVGAMCQAVYSRSKTPEQAVKDFVKEANTALGW